MSTCTISVANYLLLIDPFCKTQLQNGVYNFLEKNIQKSFCEMAYLRLLIFLVMKFHFNNMKSKQI